MKLFKKKRKPCAFLLAFLLLCAPAFAATSEVTTLQAATTYNNVTVATGTDPVSAGMLSAVSFLVTYDETQVGNNISAAVALEMSYDKVTWVAASFYDYAGGATLQTSETISADGNYVFWVNPDLCAPYYHVTVTATNTDVDDLLVVTVKAAVRG